jgi:hypothetical protein
MNPRGTEETGDDRPAAAIFEGYARHVLMALSADASLPGLETASPAAVPDQPDALGGGDGRSV